MIDTHFYIPQSKVNRLTAVYTATDGNIVVNELGNIFYNLIIQDEIETIWLDTFFAGVDALDRLLSFQGNFYVASNGKLKITTNSIVVLKVIGPGLISLT